jgi:hypothetical protein
VLTAPFGRYIIVVVIAAVAVVVVDAAARVKSALNE